MDIDRSNMPNGASLNIHRTIGTTASVSNLSDVIGNFRPTKLFRRDDVKDNRPQPHVLSLDYDDEGEYVMASASDETIQIYHVKEGRHDKSLVSKKYGVKLAKFTHTNSSIIYASTKQNDAIRYLATHDNSFIRYFDGHEGPVTSLAVHPGSDNFISCSQDNTVLLWDTQTKNYQGKLFLRSPYLAAYDPSGKCLNKGWTKLEFSNDGKSLLVGTRGNGHFLLDAFEGTLKAYLRKPNGGTRRLAVGETAQDSGASSDASNVESSGECCFAPDGRYVLSGSKKDVLVWDTMAAPDDNKVLEPSWTLPDKREAAVLAFNPRYNFFATADQELLFWLPDPHA